MFPVETGLRAATGRGASLIVLPECSTFLGPEPRLLELLSDIDSGGEELLSRLSRELQVCLIAGTYSRADDGRAYNTLLAYDRNGSEVARYRKIHLFDVNLPDEVRYEESRYIKPGACEAMLLQAEAFGTLGFSICYDLRFPELYRELSRLGADVLLIPAAFTEFTGRDHWEILLRARAIENLAYVIAPAQVGVHFGKRESHGHAMIIDPWGRILADVGKAPDAFALAEIDPLTLAEARARLPSLGHRRL